MQSLESIANYFGIKKLPEIAGTKSGPLVVMATARCIWEDLKDLPVKDYESLAVNDMAWYYVRVWEKPLHHASSHEWEWFRENCLLNWECQRTGEMIPVKAQNFHSCSQENVPGAHHWDTTKNCGTSGLYGLIIGVLMGYYPVILCGCPVDGQPHFYDPQWRKYDDYLRQGRQTEWKKAAEIMKGRAFSMSGNTKEWLGCP